MENSIYVGLSRQVALQREMDTIANNIANVNTPGYRGQYMMFTEFVEKPKGIDEPLSMVLDYGQFMSNKPGPMQHTGNPLDVALQGPGFIGINVNDETLYTRAGNFMINQAGELVTPTGDIVSSEGGSAISIPEDARSISIAEDGTISTDQGPIGKMMVVEFENIDKLDAVGDNNYRAVDIDPSDPENTRVISGMLEGSNINAVMEMSRMIQTERAYQATVRMLQNEHERQRTMIQRLSQGQ